MTRASLPTSRRREIPIELLLTLVIATVFGGSWLRKNPVTLDAPPVDTVLPSAPEENVAADVLVVLPETTLATGLDGMAFDATWLSTVEQEVGPVRFASASLLARTHLDGAAWVIVPRTSAAQLDPAQVQFLRSWVEDGGVALVEQPEGPWESIAGQVFGATRLREARRLTSFDGAVTRGNMREVLLGMPLQTSLATYNPATLSRGRDYNVLLEIDGQPGVVEIPARDGSFILLLFDFGRYVGTMQQGRPQDDLTVPPPTSSRGPITSDLVASETLRTATVPYADLLERNLVYLLDERRPVGRLWGFPGAARGALVATHSEAAAGEMVGFMPEWEHTAGVRSTIFAVARSLTPEALSRVSRIEADVQLQVVPPGHALVPHRYWGVGRFEPVRREMSIAEQRDALADDLAPYGPVVATRTLDGAWSGTWAGAFEALDAVGAVIDTSYAPSRLARTIDGLPREEAGYLFGTGLPFRPLAPTGHRFAVMELPTTLSDAAAGYSVGRLRELIIGSASGYHTAIVADWRPDTMSDRPSFDALEGWRSAFGLATTQELWLTTVAEYAEFVRRRAASRVRSEFVAADRRLVIDAELVGPERGVEDPMALTPSVAFPTRYDNRPVTSVLVDGAPRDPSTIDLSGDRVLHILPLSPGSHRIEVQWSLPAEIPVMPDLPF